MRVIVVLLLTLRAGKLLVAQAGAYIVFGTPFVDLSVTEMNADMEWSDRGLDLARRNAGLAKRASAVHWNAGWDVAHSRADEVLDDAWQCYAISAGRIELPALAIGVEAPTLATRELSEEREARKAEGRQRWESTEGWQATEESAAT